MIVNLPSRIVPPQDIGLTGSLAESICSDLLSRILSGEVQPGEVLRQEELASRYSVSRVPVREALNRLVSSGLMELRPRRGYAVSKLDPEEIQGIFELRTVVEGHAGHVAAERKTSTDVAEVLALLEAMERLSLTNGSDFARWLVLNRNFHARLFESSRRMHLCRVAQMLRDIVEPYIRLEVSVTGDVAEAQNDHRQIFEAFRAGDAPYVADLCRKHCEHTAERLLRALRRRQPAPANSTFKSAGVSAPEYSQR